MGDRILNYMKTVTFTDKTNFLTAELLFNHNVKFFWILAQIKLQNQSKIGKLTSAVRGFFKKTENKPAISDSFSVVIYFNKNESLEAGKHPVCEGRYAILLKKE